MVLPGSDRGFGDEIVIRWPSQSMLPQPSARTLLGVRTPPYRASAIISRH